MSRATLEIQVRDNKGNLVGDIPAWVNFLNNVHSFDTIHVQLLKYNARMSHTNININNVAHLQTDLVFDTESDRTMFLLRWS